MKFGLHTINPIRLKRVALLCIAILLLSVVAIALHDHADGESHDNCPICVASNHQSATGPSASAFDGIPCFTETTVVTPTQAFTDNPYFFSYSTRGPPA
jgi:hypothetical protein